MKKGYYKVKFYNYPKWFILFFNGEGFESFKSDCIPNDEIETYDLLDENGNIRDGITIDSHMSCNNHT